MGGVYRNGIARLNSDGSPDLGFGAGWGPNNIVCTLALQPDGQVLIGGLFTEVDGVARNHVARLTGSGALDSDFDPGEGADGNVLALALQPDGKVLIAGSFDTVDGVARGRIARLNADGSLDTGFSPGAGADGDVLALALQADGKVLIAGKFTTFNGAARQYVARLNANGSLDAGFDPGAGPDDFLTAVAAQPDGRVLIAGPLTEVAGTARNGIARLNSNGSLDTGFNPGTGASGGVILDVFVQEDGRILIVGSFTHFTGEFRNRLARINANSSLDIGFFPGNGANNTVRSIALQPGAKIVIAGDFSTYTLVPAASVARLNGGTMPGLGNIDLP